MKKPDMLATLLTQELEEMFVQWGKSQPPRTGLRASSLLVPDAEWCVRRHVLAEVTPAPERDAEEHDWRTNAFFLHGWRLHEKWQDLFKRAGLAIPAMQKSIATVGALELDLTHYDEQHNIFFSPDAIIEYAGVRYIVEIKGINTKDFQFVKDGTLEDAMHPNKSIRGAVPQAQLYMHLSGVHHAIILVEDKNNQDFALWLLDYDAEAALGAIARAEQVGNALTAYALPLASLPPRVCQSSDNKLAQRCPLRTVCFRSVETQEPRTAPTQPLQGEDD